MDEYGEVILEENQFYWLFHSNDSYSAVKLLQLEDDECKVEDYETGQRLDVSAGSLVGMIPAPGELTLRTIYDDLTEAVDISEASILWNMRKKYDENKIYSSIGPILIALNPYCYIDALYNDQVLQAYIDGYENQLPPHIWTIAKASFDQLKRKSHRQAIVISGESGAGKTETTKKCLAYLSAVSMGKEQAVDASGSAETPIEDRVLGSNPILESFGNAKTCRNNNSSRFGKWLEINFSCGMGKFTLIGANITQYLLEKSRVVGQAENERNYHIFYQMCADEASELGSADNYAYLNQSGCTEIDGVDDFEEFQITKSAYVALNFPEQDVTAILNALKAILHLGNISFEDASTGEGSNILADSINNLQEAANLLGFSEEALSTALLIRTLNVRGEVMVVPLDPVQAVDTRNAFSKEIYGRLFAQIVHQANKSLSFKANVDKKDKKQKEKIVSIGLLDIFGFEIFVSNSFEQLCINYGNEKLQQYFINFVLKKEQETYESEGIDVDKIETIDNEDILQFLEMKKTGLFSLLDEELRLPRGSDSGFLKKVEKEHKEKSSRFRQDFRMKKDNFEIQHFAGTVLYDATNFLDKNKDKMYDHLEDLMDSSAVSEFKQLMEIKEETDTKSDTKRSSGAKKQVATLASRFTGQLQALVTVLQESEPHFVRCLKPNSEKSASLFESQLVLQQLRYSGVLEAIQVRKSGYPTRKLHNDFFSSYRVLSGIPLQQLKSLPSDRKRCETILEKIAQRDEQLEDIRVGNTMIFYRPDTHNLLENWRMEIGLKAVLFLQSGQRRLAAMKRVTVFSSARASLLGVMDMGREDNTSNIEALSYIKDNIVYCESIGLPCVYLITEANCIIQRLEIVKTCIEKMDYFLSEESSQFYVDFTVEFTTINEVLEEAEAIELSPAQSSFVALKAKRDDMKERASIVLELRHVITQFDEQSLGKCLQTYNTLRQKYGDFCEEERAYAVDLYDRMVFELNIIESAISFFHESQKSLSARVGSLELSDADSGNLTGALKESMTPIVDCIEPLLAPGYVFATVPTGNIVKAFEIVLEVRIQWALADWNVVADTVVLLLEVSKNIWPTDCTCASHNLQQHSNVMADLVAKELSLVSGGIDVHVILPLLCQGIQQGIAEYLPTEGEGEMLVDTEPLEKAIIAVRKFITIGPQAKIFLDFVESVLVFRRAIPNDDYEVILALTEPMEVTNYRYMRSSEILKFLNRTSGGKYMDAVKEKECVSYSLFPRRDMANVLDPTRLHKLMIKERSKGLSGPLIEIVGNIEKELTEGRKYALNRYSHYILLSSLEQWRTTVTANSVKILLLNDDLTESLTLSLAEVTVLWESDLILKQSNDKDNLNMEQDFYNPFTNKLVSICTKLVEARKLLKNEEYDKIVELYTADYFKFSLILTGRMSIIPLVPKILKYASEEILIIVAESRNIKCENLLRASFEMGSVTGILGEINKSAISHDKISEAIHMAEACIADDVRESSPLKILVDVASALVGARRAFLGGDVSEQRHSLDRLLALRVHFPAVLTAEVEVMANEADFNDCHSQLEAGLEWESCFRYLAPGRRQSVLGHGGSGSSTVDNDDADALVPNRSVLKLSRLLEGLEVAARLQKTLGVSSFSTQFLQLYEAANFIQNLREAVLNLDWENGENILETIKQSNIAEKVPIIKEEITEATRVISNAVHILNFERALNDGKPQPSSIDLAIVDLSKTTVERLEKSIDRYRLNTSKSKKTKALYNAAVRIKDLRRALLGGDWGSVNTVLKQLKEEEVGSSAYTAICLGEIEVVTTAVQNQILIRSLKTALNKEAIEGKPGKIEIENISVVSLSAAVEASMSVGNIESIGKFLSCMTLMAEDVIKGRSAAHKSDWEQIRDHAEIWYERIDNFRAKGRWINDNLMSVRPKSSGDETTDNGGSASSVSFSTTSQFAIKEYEYLATILTNEVNCIQNHVNMLFLEEDVNLAIQEGGVSSKDMVGNIDLSVIRTDGLETVLGRKTKLENDTNSILPENVEKLCKAAQLILQIRKEILQENWSTVPALLEEAVTGSYHPLPEACRTEVQVIRLECENRYIISMLTNALSSGGLEGTVDEHCSLDEVQSSSLDESVSFCTTMKPQTELALSLFHTCQQVLKLRKLLKKTPPQWNLIKQEAEVSLNDEGHLYSTGLKEIRLIHMLAENTVVCELLEAGLETGGPTGEPGHLDVSAVTSEDLLRACQIAEETTVKSKKANELLNACQLVASLRNAIVSSSNEEDSVEGLTTIISFVNSIRDIHAKNPKDHGWAFCKAEVTLVTKDAHIQELNVLLQNSVAVATQVYAHRNEASIGSKTSSRKKKVSQAPPAVLEIESLDEILKKTRDLDFTTLVLDDLVGCARALRLLRMAMINDDWEFGSQLAKREDIINPITSVPYAVVELNYAKQEAHNKITASRLEAVLVQDFMPPGSEETENDMRHTYLATRIQEAEESDITAISAKQLLECAKNVLLLRVGFSAKDSKQVATALRWFQMNAYRCPPCVQEEAQKAYIMHQNSLLVSGLTAALQVGYATGTVGDLNISSIDTQTLSKLLVQAKAVKHKTPEVKELVEMAEMIHALRCAQRTNDPKGVAKAMSFMSGRNKVLPAIVVQEIAFARIEKDNELTYSALKRALTTFDDSVSKSLEISLHNSDNKSIGSSASGGIEEHKARSKSPLKKTPAKKSRRYSMANMNRADIDLDSIDIVSLDEGMEAARMHGLFTNETKQLFRTVSIIKMLRVAMKLNDWPRVEEILMEIESTQISQGKLHPLADNEIMTIEKQLEMRTAIVDLSKSLKVGWARCSNGIVDTQNMQINSLIDAIRRAEKSMQDLGLSKELNQSNLEYASSTHKGDVLSAITFKDIKNDLTQWSPSLVTLQNTFASPEADAFSPLSSTATDLDESKSKVHKQVEKLLLSALVIIDVRKALYEGRIQHAGGIAEASLQGNCIHPNVLEELQHYAAEIGRALNMMRLCDQLRLGMKNGDSSLLRVVIKESKESKVSLSDDLGLLRTLEKAEVVFNAIVKVEKSLKSISNVYDAEDIQITLETARELNVTGPLVDTAVARLATLQQFNLSIADLNIQSGGMVTGKEAQKMVCEIAEPLDLSNHPLVKRARVLLRLTDAGFTSAIVAEACVSKNPYNAATESIKYKRSLLKLPEFQEKFILEKFERLRDPSIFTMRLALQFKEQKSSILRYTDSPIGTSLTNMPPVVATLAVFVFTHIVKVIDENASTAPEVLLRNLINIGRSCPLMRDEILLQIVKQLRSNPSEESECRVWYMLRACLNFFPPSNFFENYLECFLLSCINARMDTRSHLAQQCIRNMHHSIFLHGYNQKVFSGWDSSLGSVKLWLTPLPPPSTEVADSSLSLAYAPPISKPLGINTKCDLYYGTMDPAFFQGPNRERTKLLSGANLRGTRDNWVSRFKTLGGADPKGVTLSEFATAIFSPSPSSQIDTLDREALLFWLSGNLPSPAVIAKVQAEVLVANELLLPLDGEEEYRMFQRRKLLTNLPISAPRRLHTMDAQGEALAVFFETVEHCSMQDKALLNPVSSDAKSRPRKRFSFVESSDTIISEDEDDEEIFFTSGMYRDFVFVGMEKIIESSLQL